MAGPVFTSSQGKSLIKSKNPGCGDAAIRDFVSVVMGRDGGVHSVQGMFITMISPPLRVRTVQTLAFGAAV